MSILNQTGRQNLKKAGTNTYFDLRSLSHNNIIKKQ